LNEWTDAIPLLNMILLIALCIIVLRRHSK